MRTGAWIVLLWSMALTCCGGRAPRRERPEADSIDGAAVDGATVDGATRDAPRDAPLPTADAQDAVDAHDDRAPDFQLVLLDRAPSVVHGEMAPLRIRVDRVGGFSAPVLVDLWGLPDTVWAQAREARVDDGTLEITLEASEDAPPTESVAFAVQASALGIRRVVRTTLRIE